MAAASTPAAVEEEFAVVKNTLPAPSVKLIFSEIQDQDLIVQLIPPEEDMAT